MSPTYKTLNTFFKAKSWWFLIFENYFYIFLRWSYCTKNPFFRITHLFNKNKWVWCNNNECDAKGRKNLILCGMKFSINVCINACMNVIGIQK